MGYALSGLTIERCLLFIAGLDGNGKSVFINTIRTVMGNYATVAAMATFGQHPRSVCGFSLLAISKDRWL